MICRDGERREREREDWIDCGQEKEGEFRFRNM